MSAYRSFEEAERVAEMTVRLLRDPILGVFDNGKGEYFIADLREHSYIESCGLKATIWMDLSVNQYRIMRYL